MGCEPLIAFAVATEAGGRKMMFTVNFDNEAPFVNHKISNIWSNRSLPTDMNVVKSAKLFQLRPEPTFAFGHITPQPPGVANNGRSIAGRYKKHPHP